MTLDSVKYTLPNGREAVALVNLETFTVARPISGRSPSTGIPFIAVSFVSTSSVFEQTAEQWRDLKGKLTALLVRGRNSLDGISPLQDPVIVRPPARDPGNPFSDNGLIEAIHIGPGEMVSRTVSRSFNIGPGETAAYYSAMPSPAPSRGPSGSLAEAEAEAITEGGGS